MIRDKEVYRVGDYSLTVNAQGTYALLFTLEWCARPVSLDEGKQDINRILIANAHDALTYKMGRPEYAPNVHEIQAWIDSYIKSKATPTSEAANTETC